MNDRKMIANSPIGKVWVVRAPDEFAWQTGYLHEVIGFAEGQEGDPFDGFDQTALVCINGVIPNSTSCPISSGSVTLLSPDKVGLITGYGMTKEVAAALLRNFELALGRPLE